MGFEACPLSAARDIIHAAAVSLFQSFEEAPALAAGEAAGRAIAGAADDCEGEARMMFL